MSARLVTEWGTTKLSLNPVVEQSRSSRDVTGGGLPSWIFVAKKGEVRSSKRFRRKCDSADAEPRMRH